MDEPCCVLCLEPILPGQESSTKTGCDGIKPACEAMGLETITITSGQKVHSGCRKTHCNPHCIASHNSKRPFSVTVSDNKPRLRSTEALFDYSKHCLFCGTSDIYDGRRADFKVVLVRTYDYQTSIIISVNFRTGKQIPKRCNTCDSKRAKLGRPTHDVQTEAFLKVTQYLEQNDDEQLTINTLIQKMAEYIDDTDIQPYGFIYMKAQIQKHFGNKVNITEINGKPNVVTFWSTATANQEWHQITYPEERCISKLPGHGING